MLLAKGYDATTIGDIAEACGIQRASFYTYFTSKQDVLLAMGENAERAGLAAARRLNRLNPQSSMRDIAAWVNEYFAFWDTHGAFIYAAFQAAYAHPELREWSIDAEMQGAKVLGKALVKLRGEPVPEGVDLVIQGLALESMMERFWFHWRVAGANVRDADVPLSIAQIIWAVAHPQPVR